MGWNLSRLYSRSRTESPELGSPSVFIAEYILILFEVNLLSSTTSLSLIFRPKKIKFHRECRGLDLMSRLPCKLFEKVMVRSIIVSSPFIIVAIISPVPFYCFMWQSKYSMVFHNCQKLFQFGDHRT